MTVQPLASTPRVGTQGSEEFPFFPVKNLLADIKGLTGTIRSLAAYPDPQ